MSIAKEVQYSACHSTTSLKKIEEGKTLFPREIKKVITYHDPAFWEATIGLRRTSNAPCLPFQASPS